MMLRARAWPVLLLLALPLPGHADPRSVIGDCVARIDARTTGLSELEKSCPDLEAALEQAQLRPLLTDSSSARLDRHSLIALQRLLQPAAGRGPDVATLQPILRGLTTTAPPHRSWLQRLWDWLVEHATPHPQQGSSKNWLAELMRLATPAQWLWTALIWVILIALPIGVGVVIWFEVRAMGRRSDDQHSGVRVSGVPGHSFSQLAALRAAPLTQRPAFLFALLIGRLIAAGRLPPDRSLTHREVARGAQLDDAEQRRLIESLARLAERQLYATTAAAPEGLAELLARGEDLYTTGWGRPTEVPK